MHVSPTSKLGYLSFNKYKLKAPLTEHTPIASGFPRIRIHGLSNLVSPF